MLTVPRAWRFAVTAWVALGACCGPAAEPEPARDPALDLFYSANALYNRRLYPIAIKEYEQFLRKHPRHAKAEAARYGLALSHYSLGNYGQAEPLLAALAAAGKVGEPHRLRLLRAHCLLRQGNAAAAEGLFAEVSRSGAARELKTSALAGLAEARFRRQKWPETAAAADALLALEPRDEELERALYQGAWARHQLGKFKEALTLLERLVPLVEDRDLRHQVAYLVAECCRQTGDPARAARQYALALEALGGLEAAEVNYRLGFVLFELKRYAEALAAFEQAVQGDAKGPFVNHARLYMGRCRFALGDPNRARQLLEPLTGGDGDTAAEACLWLGRVRMGQKQHDQAIALLGRAIQRFGPSPFLPDLLFDHANALVARDRYAEAEASLARIADKQWPLRNDVLRLRAVCLHRTLDYRNSLRVAEAFLADYPEDDLSPEVLFVRAENLYFLERGEDAMKQYRSFLTDHPEHGSAPAARLRVAQLLHRRGQWAEALTALAPLLEDTPERDLFAQVAFLAGDCHFRLSHWEEAAGHLESFVKLARRLRADRRGDWEPNTHTALDKLAVARTNRDQADLARVAYRSLLKEHPASPHVPLALAEAGRAAYEAGDLREARQLLQRCATEFAKGPQRPHAEYYLGWIDLKEKRPEAAAQHFGTVFRSHARDELAPDAALQLGLILQRQEKHPEAERVFGDLIRAYPEHPRMDLAVFSLGLARARQKKWRPAAGQFAELLERFPGSDLADRALYEWAWCEKGREQPDQAVKRYEQLLAQYPESELAAPATAELAELKFEAEDYDAVIAKLKQALEGLEDKELREQTLYRLGTAYFNKGDLEQSALTFGAFLREFPHSELAASAHFQAGESRMKLKETLPARDHFAAAVNTRNPRIRESALLRLGEAQALTRQWPQSGQAYRRLLEEFPQSRWQRHARFGLAWATERQGAFDRAIPEYRKVLGGGKKDVLSARAQFQLGECLFSLKKYEAAIQELIKVDVAYGYDDWSAKALLEMGRAMEAREEDDKAIEQFKEVIKRFPEHTAAAAAKERLDALRRARR